MAGTDNGGEVMSVGITAGAANVTGVLRSGGASGTIIAYISAVANTSNQKRFAGAVFSGPLHLTLTGAGVLAEVEFV